MQTATLVYSEDEECQMASTVHARAIERTIQTMHTHLHELLTLEDLASVAYLSPYYFNRVFRRQIGIPPVEFLSALRFQTARRLLLTTHLNVTDICFEVGYTSTGSFTHRFTQLTGLSPRLLRQRAHEFDLSPTEHASLSPIPFGGTKIQNTLQGYISVPETFHGVIYIGLFTSPIPQGRPIRYTKLRSSGLYQLNNVADGVYYLLSAAFPVDADLQAYFLPGKHQLLGHNSGPLIVSNGHVSGDPNLVLHPSHLTDAPLVLALPLL